MSLTLRQSINYKTPGRHRHRVRLKSKHRIVSQSRRGKVKSQPGLLVCTCGETGPGFLGYLPRQSISFPQAPHLGRLTLKTQPFIEASRLRGRFKRPALHRVCSWYYHHLHHITLNTLSIACLLQGDVSCSKVRIEYCLSAFPGSEHSACIQWAFKKCFFGT